VPRNPSGPPPVGPIAGPTLSKTVAQQLVKFARVKPRSLACPSLPRKQGATVICHGSGTALDEGGTQVQGMAQITVQDTTGHSAQVIFDFRGSPNLVIRGSGSPFDPDTGRVL
jgi:hypothetical protein